MHCSLRKAAVALAFLATIVTTVLRVVLSPHMQDTGASSLSYCIIGVILVSMVVIVVLVLAGGKEYPKAVEMGKHGRSMVAYSEMFFGSILLVSSLYDAMKWLSTGKTPAPNTTIINSLDGITLFLTLVFGILAALFMIWIGIVMYGGRLKQSANLSLTALAPVVWIWVRLVRYEVSYASAVQVSQSFYDFIMLIFTMLLLFSYARYISGIGGRSPRTLLICALCTMLMSISGTITSLILYASVETQALQYSRLAGFADFGAGVFAICVALALVFSKQEPAELKPEPEPQIEPESTILGEGFEDSPDLGDTDDQK